jgi:hypothetical protein
MDISLAYSIGKEYYSQAFFQIFFRAATGGEFKLGAGQEYEQFGYAFVD